jgi:bifunctional UDP-N-acetylglucosamine pyrophosphorylase/glucosamine-1-phosphate N-acetyltransferase
VNDLHVFVLAAGKGTRMKSELPKVLHKIGGLTIIERVIRTAAALQPASITMVVGHGAGEVKRSLAKRTRLQFVTQEQQLGTGHALLQTRPVLEGKSGTVVLLSGDAPLSRRFSEGAARHAPEAAAAATVITATFPGPSATAASSAPAGRSRRRRGARHHRRAEGDY